MPSLRIEATYPHPPARVWRALTDPLALAEWLMPNNFEPRLGHPFQFRVEGRRSLPVIVDCEVVELVPTIRLAYTWKNTIPGTKRRTDTRVTWTLEPTESGTRLILEHTGFRTGFASFVLRKMMMAPGWRRMMRRLLPLVLARAFDDGFVPDATMADRPIR